MFKLRNYQQETIDKVYQSMRTGHHRIIVQQPPRTGKTVIMSEIAKRTTDKSNRVMFIIHRKEVLEQAISTFKQQEVNMNLAIVALLIASVASTAISNLSVCIVTGKQIGRASCRERVSSPV